MNKLFTELPLLQAAGGGNATGSMVSTLVTFGLVFVIFYFLIIRPQSRKQKEAKKMIEAVKKGDRIVTIGGVHGTISSVKEKTVIVKVDDTCKMEFSKSAIASVEPKGGDEKVESETVSEKPAEEKK
jgi:preprotein translocase subunit YajC